jgi:hypothetical protein
MSRRAAPPAAARQEPRPASNHLSIALLSFVLMLGIAGAQVASFLFGGAADARNTAANYALLRDQVGKLVDKFDLLARESDVVALAARVDLLDSRVAEAERTASLAAADAERQRNSSRQ